MTVLEQEQAEMRKRWAAPAYRLEHGSVHGYLPTAEFTLGTTMLSTEELYKQIEDAYDRNEQELPKSLPSTSSEAGAGTQSQGESGGQS